MVEKFHTLENFIYSLFPFLSIILTLYTLMIHTGKQRNDTDFVDKNMVGA